MMTVYNEEENKYVALEEPDPSLSYTYADYLSWKFEEQVELIRGRIYKVSPAPNTLHQQVSKKLLSRFFNFLEGESCQVFHAPFDVRLPIHNKQADKEITTVVQPDICVICDPSKIDERGCVGAPDLVVEILSPGNTKKEVKIKSALYEEAGIKEYWLVCPAEQNIIVFCLQQDGRYGGATIYASGDEIECAAVNGLTISLDDVFQQTNEPA